MPANLVLHCGAAAATREQVAAARTPDRTCTWVPVPHHRLLDGVRDALARAGLAVAGEAHALARGGLRFFGLLQLAAADPAADHGQVVGLRNAHDRAFPAGLVVGSAVFVCDNLSFSGEVRLARRHTAHVERDLPQLIDAAVGRLGDLRRSQADRFAAYRATELADAQAHDLLVQALDARVVPATRLPAALAEWRHPRHAEFRTGGRTAWRLLNAVTETLKGNLDALPRRTQALHGLLDAACGLAVGRN